MLDPRFSPDLRDAVRYLYGEGSLTGDPDYEVAQLIDHVIRDVDPGERASYLSEGARAMCLAYGYRNAALAVRRHSAYCLARAALAVVVGGANEAGDPSATRYLVIVADASRRLDVDAASLVASVAAALGEGAADALRTWLAAPLRPELADVAVRAVGEGREFDYEVAPG